MTTMTPFIKRHPVLTYFTLTFAISWGGFLVVGGSGLFAGTRWQTDPAFLAAVQVTLTGPPIAGLLMTVLVSGTAGLREMHSRLLKWRVEGRWYVVALLTAPILETAVLLALSRTSPVFLPAIATADDRAALLASGITFGRPVRGGTRRSIASSGRAVCHPKIFGSETISASAISNPFELRILSAFVRAKSVAGHTTHARCVCHQTGIDPSVMVPRVAAQK